MSLSSLYNTISETNTSIPQTSEPPPIIKSDVSQYTNILAKKSYLNESRKVLKENVPTQPAAQPAAQQPQLSAGDIVTMLQNVQRKYNSSTSQEKVIITKILSALV